MVLLAPKYLIIFVIIIEVGAIKSLTHFSFERWWQCLKKNAALQFELKYSLNDDTIIKMGNTNEYSFLNATIDLIRNPNKAFPYFINVASFDKRMIFIALYGICTAVYKIDFEQYPDLSILIFKIFTQAIFGFIGGWIGLYLYALLVTFINGLFKSETEINDNLSILTFSSIPFIIGLILILIIKIFFSDWIIIAGLIYLLAYLWMLQISIIGNKINSKLNLLKSLVSTMSPYILFFIIYGLIYLFK